MAATPGGFLIGWTQQNGPGRGSEAYVSLAKEFIQRAENVI